jgi:hypothetical protein
MIELEIYWKSDNDVKLSELGLECMDEPELKKFTFLNINAFYPYDYDENIPKPTTVICCNDSEYIAKISYDELKLKLKS